MKWLRILTLYASIVLGCGENKDSSAVEQLPPIMIAPENHGHVNPVLTESVDEKNLLGQPDGHEQRKNPIGQPDGHEDRSPPLIGQQDGHEDRNNLFGQPDGHEQRKNPIGQQDGHEEWPQFGRPDGHELENPAARQTDGSGSKSKNEESSEESLEDYDEKKVDIEYPSYNDGYPSYSEYDDNYDDDDGSKPLIRCTRPLCEMYCPMGFQYDENSCPICECLKDPCQTVKCNEGKKCRIIDCESLKNCKQLTAECVDDTPVCATPMCANLCENGYYYNEYGCMTCDCVGSDDPNPPEKNVECPQIDCVNQQCVSGFMTDDNGCMTCQCKDDIKESFPCAMPMCANVCENGYHYDEHGCMNCECAKTEQNENKPGDTEIREKPVCAEPMCANRCALGYARDERGCLTCDCAMSGQKCGRQVCEKDEKCLNHTINEKEMFTCVPTPLCQALKESGHRLSAFSKCDESGKFSPVQCNAVQSQCWCVDDRGVVIDGTSTSVYIDEHKPHCEKNITVGGTVHVRLVTIAASHPAYIDSYTVTDLLTSDIPLSFSYCTLVDKDYISVVKVEKVIGGDEAATGGSLTAVGSTFYAEVNFRNDGVVDLSAALDRLKRRIVSGKCVVAIENGAVLEPAPESLVIEYKFSHTPARQPLVTNLDNGMYSSEESLIEYYYNHKYALVFVSLLAIVVTSAVLLVVIMVVRRRRRMDFQHQRLDTQISTTSEKSLLDSRDDSVLLINSGSETKRMVNA